jgi:hypothetical protein
MKLVMIITCALVIGGGVYISLIPRHYRCQDFKTQKEAQRAFEKGAYYLDRDKDGKACQNLR